MNKRRVVITGIGAITCLGLDIETIWNALTSSKSGISKISKFDDSWLKVKIAGCVPNSFNPEDYIEPREVKRMDLFIQYAIASAENAIKDSGIVYSGISEEDLLRTGVILSSGIGGLYTIEQNARDLYANQNGKTSPFFILASLVNMSSGYVSIKHSFRGPNHAVCTACATGVHAIGDAYKLIAYNDADVMIAGSSEASVTPLGISGFASMHALASKFNDNPEGASRPWDQDRCGFVMSDGAGTVVLEEYERAKKRGAKIYAELVGYGLSGDAHHMTSPHPEGLGATNAMKLALKSASVDESKVGYVNAHGTSTIIGDEIELKAVQNLFLDKNKNIKMSSIKSSMGHALGASGAIEAIATILSLKNQVAPPTINLENQMQEAVINLVPNFAQEINTEYAISNSFGFGGTNASVIFKKI